MFLLPVPSRVLRLLRRALLRQQRLIGRQLLLRALEYRLRTDALERLAANGDRSPILRAAGVVHGLQRGAVLKGALADRPDPLGERNAFKAGAVVKHALSNGRDACRDRRCFYILKRFKTKNVVNPVIVFKFIIGQKPLTSFRFSINTSMTFGSN